MDELTRRQIRYICFRLQIEASGGNEAKAGDLNLEELNAVKKHFEGQEQFGGWDRFGNTWDVDENDPLVAVKRGKSIQVEWEEVVEEEARELPVKKPKSSKKKKK